MKRSLLVVFFCLVFPLTGMAQPVIVELGLRGGVNSSSVEETYSAGEAYYLHALPWRKDLSPETSLYTRLDAGVGYMHADSRSGNWLAIGADAVLSTVDGLLEFEIGVRPAWLSRHEFGEDDFGGAVQFLSHAGVALNLGRVVVNYRLQHLSNAGIYDNNPGINLHLFGVGFRF